METEKKQFDYLIVGAGLFGATFAHLMSKVGKKCLVIEKEDHIGGLCYTEEIDNIMVHKFGPHIFHTKSKKIWDFINQFGEFNNYTHRVKANRKGKLYSFPINLQTFYELYEIYEPRQAIKINLEEIIAFFYKDYTVKLWGPYAKDIPRSILERIPIRYNYNDSYYSDDEYQGIPKKGYTKLIENMLDNIEVQTNTEFFLHRESYENIADKIVYTGRIDELFDFCYGELPYRKLYFIHERKNTKDYQGITQINYCDSRKWTRIIEHKHFLYNYTLPYTIITYEYPEEIGEEFTDDPPVICYPIETVKYRILWNKYANKLDKKYIIGGRLGQYRYMNMDQVIKSAIESANFVLELENAGDTHYPSISLAD